MDDLVRDNVSAKEAEMHAIYDERLRNYDERCAPETLIAF
jgi:homeobox protein cut-like